MKLKYRLLQYDFPYTKSCYVSQYKMFGIWMNIGISKNYFFDDLSTRCESYKEAWDRIINHKTNMKRSYWWFSKGTKILICKKL